MKWKKWKGQWSGKEKGGSNRKEEGEWKEGEREVVDRKKGNVME